MATEGARVYGYRSSKLTEIPGIYTDDFRSSVLEILPSEEEFLDLGSVIVGQHLLEASLVGTPEADNLYCTWMVCYGDRFADPD